MSDTFDLIDAMDPVLLRVGLLGLTCIDGAPAFSAAAFSRILTISDGVVLFSIVAVVEDLIPVILTDVEATLVVDEDVLVADPTVVFFTYTGNMNL